MTIVAAFQRWPLWGRTLYVLAAVAAAAMIAIGLARHRTDSRPPTVGGVVACLNAAGGHATTNPDALDVIAEQAGLGGVHVTMAGNAATVALDRTSGDAARTEGSYRLFARGLDVPVDDVLVRDGTAVVMFDKAPTDRQRRMVAGCL